MDISVTAFKAQCLDLIHKVESSGRAITIRRRGRVVARLEPANNADCQKKPWEALRALGGRAEFAAEESILQAKDFGALR
jgi:antitoxin (DNA-binding transcriptional repressor) of toxin-antitoxin stability system